MPPVAQARSLAHLLLGHLLAWAPMLSRSPLLTVPLAVAQRTCPSQQAAVVDLRIVQTAAAAQAYRQWACRLGRVQLPQHLSARRWQSAQRLGQQLAMVLELARQALPHQSVVLEGRLLPAQSLQPALMGQPLAAMLERGRASCRTSW